WSQALLDCAPHVLKHVLNRALGTGKLMWGLALIQRRGTQKSLAVMCPACSRSPDGLQALMESANRGLITRAGSMTHNEQDLSKWRGSGTTKSRITAEQPM